MFTILMLIAHTLADFIFQTKNIVEEKENLKLKGFLKHGITVFIFSIVFICYTDFAATKLILLITGIHIIIDFLKVFIQKKLENHLENTKYNLWKLILFIMDQILHIAVIIFITKGVSLNKNFITLNTEALLSLNNISILSELKAIFIIIYVTFSGAYIIPLFFNMIYSNIPDYGIKLNEILKHEIEESNHSFINEVKTGKWIGILERVLMLIFIYLDQLPALGVIISVKSLARFKMMENKIFSEYYLLGTLLSVSYTLIAYYFFKKLLIFI